MAMAGKISGEGAEPFRTWTRTDVIPFDSAHRYMAVLNHDHEGHGAIHVKGAPEVVLNMCSKQLGADQQSEALTPDFWHEAVEQLASGGQRAIAGQIGLKNTSQVLTGADIEMMDDGALANVVETTDIFARTSPEHKLRLVTALQARGLTVAMTGDGVNDAPALKRADAGIAMGVKGSEAAKEAAELVLADDNFSSIAAAVREGRTVYDNIKKVISWTLPTNAGEALTIIVALFAGLSLPITAVQVLWVNLVTAITLGLALAFEPSEHGTMRRPPRPRAEPLLKGELLWHIALVSGLFLGAVFGMYSYAIDRGYEQALAQTLALNTLVVLEIFHLFFIRNLHGTSLTWQAVRGTPMVWLSIVIVTCAQFAITYVPSLQSIFGTLAVPFWDGVLVVGIGIGFFALIEIEKQMRLVFSNAGKV